MDEGAEWAGGFAVVADSRVRVLSIATRCWLDGALVVAGWRTGRATAAERKHGGVRGVARATGRDAERRRDGSRRAIYGRALTSGISELVNYDAK
jgi:hypothetical protein